MQGTVFRREDGTVPFGQSSRVPCACYTTIRREYVGGATPAFQGYLELTMYFRPGANLYGLAPVEPFMWYFCLSALVVFFVYW